MDGVEGSCHQKRVPVLMKGNPTLSVQRSSASTAGQDLTLRGSGIGEMNPLGMSKCLDEGVRECRLLGPSSDWASILAQSERIQRPFRI